MGQISRILKTLVSDGRWHRYLALAIAFAIGCSLLSWWQFSRRAETAAANALITSNASAATVPIADLLPTLTTYRSTLQWRTVEVRGTYLRKRQLLVRDRVDPNGDPGFEVLTPLRMTDGTVFVLDRGWVSIGSQHDRPDSVPPAPKGTVTVRARLQENEGHLAGRYASKGEIPSVDLKEVAKQVGLPTYTGAYGQVRTESPAAATIPQRLVPQAADIGTDEGTHLSYGIQWILFALLGFGALGWSIRRDLLDAGDDVIVAAEEQAIIRRSKRAPSDESVEDELTDAR